MSFEQSIKDLQAQNAQFQQMFISLAKGQEHLKALILKEKNKKKKVAGIMNMGRRFGGHLKRQDFPSHFIKIFLTRLLELKTKLGFCSAQDISLH